MAKKIRRCPTKYCHKPQSRVVACPSCRSHAVHVVSERVWETSRRKVYKCASCRIVFLSPAMEYRKMNNFYKNYEGYDLFREPINKEYVFRKREKKTARARMDLLKLRPKRKEDICEIGASHGYFLELISPFARRVIAVEPNKKRQASLRKKQITFYSFLKDIPEGIRFDWVYMFHFFEHIKDPDSYLNDLKAYLKSKARIVVEVPNIRDALISLYHAEAFKRFYFQLQHCFYYEKSTLDAVFKRNGFNAKKCHHIQRYGFSNHLQWLLEGKPGGNADLERIFQPINSSYEDLLRRKRVTDTILCVYEINN